MVPPGVVTVISTGPAALAAGAVAVIRPSPTTVNEVAGAEPKFTAVAPFRSLPVRVTTVPPASGPRSGAMPVSTGGVTS